jgi:hypothetical protein
MIFVNLNKDFDLHNWLAQQQRPPYQDMLMEKRGEECFRNKYMKYKKKLIEERGRKNK